MMGSLCCILTLTSTLLVLSSKLCLARDIMVCLRLFVGGKKHFFNSINYDSKAIYTDEVEFSGFFLQEIIKFSKSFC